MGRYLRAMLGLCGEPCVDDRLAAVLIDQGWTETMAMGAWMVAWGAAGALLLLSGQLIRTWNEPRLAVAASPMAISVIGFILHMVRAALAVSQGHQLALRGLPGGGYARLVARLTVTTPWVLVPQVLLGVGLAAFVASQVLSAT